MPLESFVLVFFSCIIFTVIASFLASICSNYSPCLLSWRAYYVVKNKRLQKLLISEQRNRSQDSKAEPEDRNKMAFVGCVIWVVLASGDNRHSGSGEKRQFWSNEKRHLQIE